jgi:hypothetical protein
MFLPGFNPLSFWTAFSPHKAVFPRSEPLPDGTPIIIKADGPVDPGLTIAVDRVQQSLTIRGTTDGPAMAYDYFGPRGYEISRGMGFTLDIDRAPTVDVFGRTNYTEKNSRLFVLTTEKGWSAVKCAEMLAAKVNKEDDFRAKVQRHADGSATLLFSRRS